MARLLVRNGQPYAALGADKPEGAGSALLWFAFIAGAVGLYWWDVEGRARYKRRRA